MARLRDQVESELVDIQERQCLMRQERVPVVSPSSKCGGVISLLVLVSEFLVRDLLVGQIVVQAGTPNLGKFREYCLCY
jgi:hypothetical protein